MLVTLTEILKLAQDGNCAVGAFNTPTFPAIKAAIAAAEKLHVPVILAHAETHEKGTPIDMIGPVMLREAEKATVPVCVHLDHCAHLDYMKKALDIGFTGAMYDGSLLPYEENLANTTKAVELASHYRAGVEAELGAMPSREDGVHIPTGPVYTKPEEAVAFCRETGINALAPSFGTAHGIYKSKPVLDLELVRVIAEKTGLPLVMHGGSGVSPDEYRTGIKNGLRKINYHTYMSHAGVEAVRKLLETRDVTYLHELSWAAEPAMEADAEAAMRVFAGLHQ